MVHVYLYIYFAGTGILGVSARDQGENGGVKSIESVKGGEMLMQALDLVEAELPAYMQQLQDAQGESHGRKSSKQQQYRNPLLLGLTPYLYMIRALRSVKAPDLEQALLVLPFYYVTRLISMLIQLIKCGLDIELCTKCAVHLLRCHQSQLLHTHSLLNEMLELKTLLSNSMNSYRTLVGTNMAGIKSMKRQWDQMQEDGQGASALKQTIKL